MKNSGKKTMALILAALICSGTWTHATVKASEMDERLAGMHAAGLDQEKAVTSVTESAVVQAAVSVPADTRIAATESVSVDFTSGLDGVEAKPESLADAVVTAEEVYPENAVVIAEPLVNGEDASAAKADKEASGVMPGTGDGTAHVGTPANGNGTVQEEAAETASETVYEEAAETASKTVSGEAAETASETVSEEAAETASETVSEEAAATANDTALQQGAVAAGDTVHEEASAAANAAIHEVTPVNAEASDMKTETGTGVIDDAAAGSKEIKAGDNAAETKEIKAGEAAAGSQEIKAGEAAAGSNAITAAEAAAGLNATTAAKGAADPGKNAVDMAAGLNSIADPANPDVTMLAPRSAPGQQSFTLARDYGDGLIRVITDKSGRSDSRYVFSLRACADTTIDPWLGSCDGDITIGVLDSVIHESPIPIYAALGVVPEDDGYSGECGVWISNVGEYAGEPVHAKLTFFFDSCTRTDESTGNNVTVYPTYILSARQDGFIGIDITDIGTRIRFDLYAGQYTPDQTGSMRWTQDWSRLHKLSADMSLNFGDIDSLQDFGFRTNDGSTASIQVYKDCEVYFQRDVPGYEGFIWMFAGDNDLQTEPDTRGEVRLELAQTSSFDIIYAGWNRLSFADVPDLRCDIGGYSQIMSYTQCVRRFLATKEKIRQGTFTPAAYRREDRRALLTYFTSYALEPYQLPAPVKKVSDSDEILAEENRLEDVEELFTYTISQHVPLERPELRYQSFVMTDHLPQGLVCKETRVITDDGTDVTTQFSIDCLPADHENRETVVFRTDAAGGAGTGAAAFYNKTYRFLITVALNQEEKKHALIEELLFENNARTEVARKIIRSDQDGDHPELETDSMETDLVRTTVSADAVSIPPVLTIHKTIDAAEEKYGELFFIYRIDVRGEDNGYTYSRYAYIHINNGELSGKTSILLDVPYSEPAMCTVMEAGNGRYRQSGLTGLTDNVTIHGQQAYVLLYGRAMLDDDENAITPDSAEVMFTNTISGYQRLSYADAVINRIE